MNVPSKMLSGKHCTRAKQHDNIFIRHNSRHVQLRQRIFPGSVLFCACVPENTAYYASALSFLHAHKLELASSYKHGALIVQIHVHINCTGVEVLHKAAALKCLDLSCICSVELLQIQLQMHLQAFKDESSEFIACFFHFGDRQDAADATRRRLDDAARLRAQEERDKATQKYHRQEYK